MGRSPVYMSTEDIQELKHQGLTHVRIIQFDKNVKKENSNVIILTFGTFFLPQMIKGAYMWLAISGFYPNRLRYYKCQRYPHHKEKIMWQRDGMPGMQRKGT